MSRVSDDNYNEPVDDPKVTSGRHKCIVLGLVVVAALAITAIVLPLVLPEDDCNCATVPNVQSTSPPISGPTAPGATPPPTTPTGETPPPAPPTAPTMPPTRSPAPSIAPTSGRLAQFIEIFLTPLSGEDAFNDRESPQYMAAEFLAEEDEIGPTLTNLDQLRDRYALATFYFAMDGDDSWFSCFKGDTDCGEQGAGSWLDKSRNHCEWDAIVCNDAGMVTEVLFANTDGNGLVGEIPPEFALLADLEVFVAVNNLITGNFPAGVDDRPGFGDLTNIKRVILNTNLMNGIIPEGFLENSPVELFFVSNNNFSGQIPASFGNIKTLTQLVMANNNFSGVIPPELGGLDNLGTLDLSGNIRIRGSIPVEIYGLSGLENLYLNSCRNLQGTLSGDISGMQSLVALRLGDTGISGTLPTALYSLGSLVELDLTGANFSGELSEQFLNLSPTLRILNLASNNFSGDIPDAFDAMTLLTSLELFGNDALVGSISTILCGRRGEGRNQLQELTVPCDIGCTCCTNNCRLRA